MRKSLLPMLAALALCGAATATALVTTAGAQTSKPKPVLAALVTPQPGADGRHRGMRMGDPGRRLHGEMCNELYARQAGRLAYLEARLDLSAAQQPLFARWKTVRLDAARWRQGDCARRVAVPIAGNRAGKRPTPVERMGREESRLKERLAQLETERPALEPLYAALTPSQRLALHPHGMRGERGEERGAPRGMGGMERRALPPGPPGMPPPP